MTRSSPRALAATVAAALLSLLGGAAPAAAAPQTEVIEGQYLRIVSTADPKAMQAMLPGDVAVWHVSISADAPEPGQIEIGLSGDGELPLIVAVRACGEPWTSTDCASGERAIAQSLSAPLDGAQLPMLEVAADAASHLRLEVTVPSDATPPENATTTLRVHAHGYGDQVEASPPGDPRGELPRTGMQLGGPLLIAVGAVLIGVAGAQLMSRRSMEPTR